MQYCVIAIAQVGLRNKITIPLVQCGANSAGTMKVQPIGIWVRVQFKTNSQFGNPKDSLLRRYLLRGIMWFVRTKCSSGVETRAGVFSEMPKLGLEQASLCSA